MKVGYIGTILPPEISASSAAGRSMPHDAVLKDADWTKSVCAIADVGVVKAALGAERSCCFRVVLRPEAHQNLYVTPIIGPLKSKSNLKREAPDPISYSKLY